MTVFSTTGTESGLMETWLSYFLKANDWTKLSRRRRRSAETLGSEWHNILKYPRHGLSKFFLLLLYNFRTEDEWSSKNQAGFYLHSADVFSIYWWRVSTPLSQNKHVREYARHQLKLWENNGAWGVPVSLLRCHWKLASSSTDSFILLLSSSRFQYRMQKILLLFSLFWSDSWRIGIYK